jgi:broad specificity phosphatase PhoE
LSRIWLVRHGQAGTRHAYDELSETGRRQARLLGEYLARSGPRFHAAFAGTLARQRQTADEVRAAFEAAGGVFPSIVDDSGWNEFDLDRVYAELGPILCEENAEFRRDYEAMKAELYAAGDQPHHQVHRRWTASDIAMVMAWIGGHPRYTGESWLAFQARISGRRSLIEKALGLDDESGVIVFTSATPIAIWASLGLDVMDDRAMRLAGVLRNASFTTMGVRNGGLRLHTFNAVPHLTDPELRTYR